MQRALAGDGRLQALMRFGEQLVDRRLDVGS
jgi:hypothetical protein